MHRDVTNVMKKYRKIINIRGSLDSLEKKRKGNDFHKLYPLIFSLSSNYPEWVRMRKGGTEPLYLSEEFVEKFSEVFFRDDGMII